LEAAITKDPVHAAGRELVHRLGDVAEIGHITRFSSTCKLASWARMTPTVRGSDLTVRHGHISKRGSARLRWVLN